MTVRLHYTELRFARVKRPEDLVPGNNLLICHVPRTTPAPQGIAPAYAHEKKLASVAYMSANEESLMSG